MIIYLIKNSQLIKKKEVAKDKLIETIKTVSQHSGKPSMLVELSVNFNKVKVSND